MTGETYKACRHFRQYCVKIGKSLWPCVFYAARRTNTIRRVQTVPSVVGVSLKDLERASNINGLQAVSKRFYPVINL